MRRNRHKLSHSRTVRRGFTLFELVISALLLGGVTMAVVPVLHWVQRERNSAAQERLALQETTNVLEFLAAKHTRGELTDADFVDRQLPTPALERLKEGQLQIEVTPEEGPPAARRVTVRVTWKTGKTKKSAPVQLTAWFYETGGTSP